MKKALVFDRIKDDHIKNWLQCLIKYFENKNIEVHTSYGSNYNFHIKYDIIFVWNGQLDIYQPLINHAIKNNIKLLFIECGWFNQKQYYYVDPLGVNQNASIMNDNFEWINQDHIDKLNKFRQRYLDGRKWSTPGKYILCPLQIESDTNVINNAPYPKMQDFIKHTENKFPNDMVIFKTHPVCPNLNYKVNGNNALVRSGNFLEMAQDAKVVYGQTSTALLESTLLGAPTEAMGNCWLNKHKENKEKLLAALVEKQIPIGELNLDYWIGKYVNFS